MSKSLDKDSENKKPDDIDKTIIDADSTSEQNTSLNESGQIINQQTEPDDDRTVAMEGSNPVDIEQTIIENPVTEYDRTVAMEGVSPVDIDQTIVMDQSSDATHKNEGNSADQTMAMDPVHSAADKTDVDLDDPEKTILEPKNIDPDATIAQNSDDSGTIPSIAISETLADANSNNKQFTDPTVDDNKGRSDDSTAQDEYSASMLSLKVAANKETYIGRFKVESTLGEGAFGAVYLAHDPQLERYVAVKVAKTGALPGKSDVDRFRREAQAAARLRHPNIVAVHEIGQVGQTNFIAYDFVRGRTIKDILKEQGAFDCQTAVQITEKLASALDYAHENGIIHRDMKPENVLLDAHGEPHILDFGLARADDTSDTTRTREGAMMGSPAYMSPEQASGRSHLADPRSDIWSIGAMFYELLCGERPFKGNITDILIAVKEKPHIPVKNMNPDVDIDLDTICSKCLQKDPDERYQTGEELAEELSRWLRGEPILARRLNIFEITWRWAKRNKAIASLIVAVFAVLMLGTIVSTLFAIDANQKKQLAFKAQNERALTQVTTLTTSPPESIELLIGMIEPFHEQTVPFMKQLLESEETSPIARARLHAGLSKLDPDDDKKKSWKEKLSTSIMNAPPGDILILREYFDKSAKETIQQYWSDLQREETSEEHRMRKAALLAYVDPESNQWDSVAGNVVGQLFASESNELFNWLNVFKPIREHLLLPLNIKYSSAELERERIQAATILATLFSDSPDRLAELIRKAEFSQFPMIASKLTPHRNQLIPDFKKILQEQVPDEITRVREEALIREKSNVACALLHLGEFDAIQKILEFQNDPRLRTEIIHQCGPCAVNPEVLLTAMASSKDPGILSALLQTIGHYGSGQLLESKRQKSLSLLSELYLNHPHAGVHSNVEWLLNRWKFDQRLTDLRSELKSRSFEELKKDPINVSWWITPSGHTMTLFNKDQQFKMGSKEDELARIENERLHTRKIPRQFAIATHEVTVRDFLKFKKDHFYDKVFAPTEDCPISSVNWIDAVHFCRWLSEQEKIPESEMCYPPVDKMNNNTKLPEDLLERTGYRLPTAGEWEFACRAGTVTSRYYGDSFQLLPKYAWFSLNSNQKLHPVGELLPNPFGLYDMHGNVSEWCQTFFFDEYPQPNADGIVIDQLATKRGIFRDLRGNHYSEPPEMVRSADRDYETGLQKSFVIGFRIARTISAPKKKSDSPKKKQP